jgi:hypothetical protein
MVIGLIVGGIGGWGGIWKVLWVEGALFGLVGMLIHVLEGRNVRLKEAGKGKDMPIGTHYKDNPGTCDELEEDREGEGDDMKAIWKTLLGKEGGVLWLKVGKDEKVPAKWVLDPVMKECKKRGIMLMVSKGSEMKVLPDLSGVSDEILKGMGLMRYNFALEAAVEQVVWKDDDET